VQSNSFFLQYNILRPQKVDTALKLNEIDSLNFSVDTDNERIVKTAIIHYKNREFDPSSLEASLRTKQKTSNIGQFVAKLTKEHTIKTLLVDESEADIFASRWAFLLELGSSVLKIETKLQASGLQIGDLLAFSHPRLYERVGGGNRKFSGIQSLKNDGRLVNIETEDLSNSFNRIGNITKNDAKNFELSTEEEKFFNSYITDDFGMIENDSETFGLNLIW
jgi:hypothetical protein